MFKNKDFTKVSHGLLVFSTVNAYNVIYEFARSWGLTWVNIPLAKFGSFRSPPLVPDVSFILFMLFFLVPALLFPMVNCAERIKAGDISQLEGMTAYFKTIGGYFIIFILLLIFYPLLGRIAYAL